VKEISPLADEVLPLPLIDARGLGTRSNEPDFSNEIQKSADAKVKFRLPLAAVGQKWHQKEALENDKFKNRGGSIVWGIAVRWFNNLHHTRNA
jgi:hypothetical protein